MDSESLFSLSDQLEALSQEGYPLEVLQVTVDFEYFRAWRVEGLGYGDGSKSVKSPAPCPRPRLTASAQYQNRANQGVQLTSFESRFMIDVLSRCRLVLLPRHRHGLGRRRRRGRSGRCRRPAEDHRGLAGRRLQREGHRDDMVGQCTARSGRGRSCRFGSHHVGSRGAVRANGCGVGALMPVSYHRSGCHHE